MRRVGRRLPLKKTKRRRRSRTRKQRRRRLNMSSLSGDEWKAISDKFTNAQNLTDVESRKDPENDPFRSKYKARELLREIYCSLKSFEAGDGEEEEEEEEERGDQRPAEDPEDGRRREDLFGQGFSGDSAAGLRAARLGAVEYYLGVNHVDTEELSAGQEHLMNCMKLLERCRVSSENVSLFIHARVYETYQQEEVLYTHNTVYLTSSTTKMSK